jgi:hypothetical protein
MKTIKTFEAYLTECGKGDKGYQKKERCPECGKKNKNCKCDKGCECEEGKCKCEKK